MLDHDTVVDEKSYEMYDPDFVYCLQKVRNITHDENLALCIDKILTILKSQKNHT